MKPLYLNTSSPAYQRMTAAGFTFGGFVADESGCYVRVMCDFSCVCGRLERFQRMWSKWEMDQWREVIFPGGLVDIAAFLEEIGSVSVEHLREDGFSPEEIARIRRPYEQPRAWP